MSRRKKFPSKKEIEKKKAEEMRENLPRRMLPSNAAKDLKPFCIQDKKAFQPLSPKQAHFVMEWLIDQNTTRAAQAAYPAAKDKRNAYQIGKNNLKNPNVKRAIKAEFEASAKTLQVTANRIVSELADIGFIDVSQFFDSTGNLIQPDQWTKEMSHAVESFEVEEIWDKQTRGRKQIGILKKVKLHNKMQALEKLAKQLGHYQDKVSIDINHRVSGSVDFTRLGDSELKALVSLVGPDFKLDEKETGDIIEGEFEEVE